MGPRLQWYSRCQAWQATICYSHSPVVASVSCKDITEPAWLAQCSLLRQQKPRLATAACSTEYNASHGQTPGICTAAIMHDASRQQARQVEQQSCLLYDRGRLHALGAQRLRTAAALPPPTTEEQKHTVKLSRQRVSLTPPAAHNSHCPQLQTAASGATCQPWCTSQSTVLSLIAVSAHRMLLLLLPLALLLYWHSQELRLRMSDTPPPPRGCCCCCRRWIVTATRRCTAGAV